MAQAKTDVSGLPIICSSEEALDCFNKGLLALVTLSESSVPWFKRAVELDQTFIMASSMMVKQNLDQVTTDFFLWFYRAFCCYTT